MKKEEKKIVYVEPADYIPEHIRRELKLGEFAVPKAKIVKKEIRLEVNFPEGFVPPERFEDPMAREDLSSACDGCAFFKWDEKRGYGWCALLGEEPETDICPIKWNF